MARVLLCSRMDGIESAALHWMIGWSCWLKEHVVFADAVSDDLSSTSDGPKTNKSRAHETSHAAEKNAVFSQEDLSRHVADERRGCFVAALSPPSEAEVDVAAHNLHVVFA